MIGAVIGWSAVIGCMAVAGALPRYLLSFFIIFFCVVFFFCIVNCVLPISVLNCIIIFC